MAFPTTLGPRSRVAWNAILDTLADDHWHPHTDLTHAAGLASDLTDKSIDELIRKGYRTRHYTRRTRPAPGQTKLQGAVYQLTDLGRAARGGAR